MLGNLKSLSCSAKQYLKVPNSCSSDTVDKISYLITVTTGSMKFAGTDANVCLRITGATGERTSLAKLDNAFRDDFERAAVDKFRVKLEDIGVPTFVTIEIDHNGLFADWFASIITVQKSGDKEIYEFPIYSWIDEVQVVPVGQARLPQNESNSNLREYRENELYNKKRIYKWRSKRERFGKGLPGYISASCHDSLPRNFQLTDGLTRTFEESKGEVLMHAFQDKLQAFSSELMHKWESLEELTHLTIHPRSSTSPKETEKGLQDDDEFGRQMINGCNPNMVVKCTALPSKFPVTNEMVKLPTGKTLEGEIKNGNVYIVDCGIAKGVKLPNNSCVPICLLYKSSEGGLTPIAIQLHQTPSSMNPIWTPSDNEWDWIAAKMHFRNAESNIQQLVYRLLRNHFILEPFALSMMRCLSSRHPVYKLLYPHLQYLCAVNTITRTELLYSGGIVDQLLTYNGTSKIELMRKAFKDFNLDSLKIPEEIKQRGLNDLEDYYYKDDVNALYPCIQNYIQNMMGLFYECGDDFAKDEELQQFIKEAHDEGFAWEDGKDRGCPCSITNMNELVELLTVIVFSASCQHAALNSPMFSTYMNVTNAPLSLTQPPPTEKGKATLQTILSSLPDRQTSCTQVEVMHTLSKYPDEEVYLGNFPQIFFVDQNARKVQDSFREELQKIANSIKERNSKIKIPYDALEPGKIPLGVTV